MIKFLAALAICSASFADDFTDRLIEIKDAYESAFAEVENGYCTCGIDPDCKALDFAYLLGKKQCMSDIIFEYEFFKDLNPQQHHEPLGPYSQVEKK